MAAEYHSHTRPRRRAGPRCLCAIALLLLLAGCTSIGSKARGFSDWLVDDPAPKHRSIQELYYEALQAGADRAEQTITPYDDGAPVPAPPYFQAEPAPAPPAASDAPVLFNVPRADAGGLPAPGSDPHAVGAIDTVSGPKLRLVSASDAGGALVSEVFQETDIRQAIQTLAEQAKVSVIMDDAIGGTTDAIIENEPFELALQRILIPLKLVYKRDGDHYLVGKDDPASSLFSMLAETAEFRPVNLSPQELAGLLPERLRSYVSVAEKRNLVIIEAPHERMLEIMDRLKRFDAPVPQVILEAIVCVISPENGWRSGFDWNHSLTMGNNQLLNLGLTGLAGGGSVTPLGLSNYFNDFAVTSAFVRLLAQEGYLTIRAAPRVMAKDGEKAEISIGRESFFSIQPNSSQFLFRQDIQRVEAGIKLNITPIIRGDNITVNIEKAEVSEDIRTNNANVQLNVNPFPLINRRTVSTTVNVKDGKTIVIGGLVTRQTVDRVSRVPGIGRCPGIGRMFEIVEKSETDVEVVIFISPRLVRPPDATAVNQTIPIPSQAPFEFQPSTPPAPPPPAEDHTVRFIQPASAERVAAPPRLPPPRRLN